MTFSHLGKEEDFSNFFSRWVSKLFISSFPEFGFRWKNLRRDLSGIDESPVGPRNEEIFFVLEASRGERFFIPSYVILLSIAAI